MHGLKAHLCKYSASSMSVLSFRMMTFIESGICCFRGVMVMSHNLSVKFLFPRSTILLFLKTFNVYLSKIAVHPSSQSWPMEINEELVNPLMTCAPVAVGVNVLYSGSNPCVMAGRLVLSGSWTRGPKINGFSVLKRAGLPLLNNFLMLLSQLCI